MLMINEKTWRLWTLKETNVDKFNINIFVIQSNRADVDDDRISFKGQAYGTREW